MRSSPWLVAVGILSLLVVGYAVFGYAAQPLGALVHPDMRAVFEANRPALFGHVFGAVVALAVGPFQLSARLRARRVALHRWLGRLYLGVGVLVGGAAGLYLAPLAFGGPVARIGFGALAVAWLGTGLRAYLAIRARDVASHRRWIVRNFALTFAAVTLRIYLPVSAAAGIPFEAAYPIIAWVCWVPNAVVAEGLLRWRASIPTPRTAG